MKPPGFMFDCDRGLRSRYSGKSSAKRKAQVALYRGPIPAFHVALSNELLSEASCRKVQGIRHPLRMPAEKSSCRRRKGARSVAPHLVQQ